MGLFAAQNYAKGESLVVYMGEDIGPADELPKVNMLIRGRASTRYK